MEIKREQQSCWHRKFLELIKLNLLISLIPPVLATIFYLLESHAHFLLLNIAKFIKKTPPYVLLFF